MARFGAITIPIVATLDKAGFKQAQSAVGKFGRMAISTLGAVAAAAAVAGAKLAMDSITAFSDYNEALNKSNVIFGDTASQIEAWAETASSTFGQSAEQALNAASSFAGLGKAAGLGDQDLVDFSKTLTVLASDLASFNNTSVDDAIQALGSGLRGEAEPLRRFNVLLNDATLRERALKMGLVDTTKNALTPAQKTLATYAEILSQTKDAQGDFIDTSDSLANSQKTLTATWKDVQRELGEALAPTFMKFVDWLKTDGLEGLQTFVDVLTGKTVTGNEWTAKNGKIERSFSPVQESAMKLAKSIRRISNQFAKLFEDLAIDDPAGPFWSLIDGLTTIVDLLSTLIEFQYGDNVSWTDFLPYAKVRNAGEWLVDWLSGGGGQTPPPGARVQRGGVNINVNGTVLDPEGTARAIQRVLTQSQRRAGAY